MINLDKMDVSEPYDIFRKYYEEANKKEQIIIEAISISSYDKKNSIVDSRFVNLKYVINDEWIFFSNYNSPKSIQFKSHEQISAVIFWNSINVQIRMKAKIQKTNSEFSNKHFLSRDKTKNLLAILSQQSEPVSSYDDFLRNYEKNLSSKSKITTRPEYWGGFSFSPYYFEFWEGHNSRINKRTFYELNNQEWKSGFLQP
jgi:pyridoxamine 5'-phosphate oxidase|tara:strand:+ start:1266 stop:1865 length:600 start_codon:yes stop_codon:yes gene_type:complete